MRSYYRNSSCIAAMILAMLVGCASQTPGNPESKIASALPGQVLPAKHVSLEIAVGQLDPEQSDEVNKLWEHTDPQAIPLSSRRILDQNGIRIAIISSQPPSVLHRVLAGKPVDTTNFQSWQKQFIREGVNDTIPRKILHVQIQNGQGEEYRVPVTDSMEHASWKMMSNEEMTAGQGENARGYIRVVTFPLATGEVDVRLVPEIHHGQFRPKIGVNDDSFLFKNEQEVFNFEELGCRIRMRPGETILLGRGTNEPTCLGQLLFGPRVNDKFDQRILLVRLVKTQLDDLFSGE